jgi:DNA-directed RNA polymerase I subunit RPA12
MPWPFCPGCKATLKVHSSGELHCDVCPYKSHLERLSPLPSIVTYSRPKPTPLWAKSEDEQRNQIAATAGRAQRATIEEPCVRCSHPEVMYYTVQLRSVDEGQTVFYECPNCKHAWSIHN